MLQAVEVYFDDFTVEHVKSPVVQQDDYYAFGLEFNSYQRENSMKNSYLYNGKEKQDELDLGWLDYGARMYMADLGRWTIMDPKVAKYQDFSPYNYAINNPLLFIDPNGEDNVIYLVTVGTYSAKQATKVVNHANKMLKKLGLETRVQLYDAGKHGKFNEQNLDKTDNWALIGNSRKQIAAEVKGISTDENYQEQVASWAKNENGEIVETSNSEKNGKGIVIDGNDGFYGFVPKDQEEQSGLELIHGAGHSSEEFTGHLKQGVMMGGNSLQSTYEYGGGIDAILAPKDNGTYVTGMKRRYGLEISTDNYSKNKEKNQKKKKSDKNDDEK